MTKYESAEFLQLGPVIQFLSAMYTTTKVSLYTFLKVHQLHGVHAVTSMLLDLLHKVVGFCDMWLRFYVVVSNTYRNNLNPLF